MTYKFVIEKFENDEFKTLQEVSGVSLMAALELLKSFAAHHRDGYLLDGSGHPVEYEVDGAELSCWIDFDD